MRKRSLGAAGGFTGALVLGLTAGSGEALWGVALVAAASMAFLSLANPTWILCVLYPATWTIGQVSIAVGGGSYSLERVLVAFAAIGILASSLKKRIIPILPPLVLVGLLLWLGAYAVSFLVHQSESFRVTGFALKAVLAYLVFIAMTDADRLQKAMSLYLFSSLFASLLTIIVFLQAGDLESIRGSSFNTGESLGESLFRGVARAGAGNTLVIWIAVLFLRQSQGWRRLLWGSLTFWFVFAALLALRREVLVTIPLCLVLLIWHKPIKMRRQGIVLGIFL